MSPKADQIFAVCHFDSAAEAQKAISELQKIGIQASAVKTIAGDSLKGMSEDQITSQFTGAGVHQDDAAYLQKELRKHGGVLAVVRTDSANEARVDEVLRRYGAKEKDEYAPGQTSRKQTGATANDTLEVIQEELVVGKRAVSRGGMRIYSRLVETPVEKQVNLREETVRVDRHKVDRPLSADEMNAMGQDRTFEVNTMGEEAVVSKTARVVEEVTLGKKASDRTETVRDTVRHTEVEVEKLDRDTDTYFQKDYQTRYGKSGQDYSAYAPAYQYGYAMASDPQYKGKSYKDVETSLRSSYQSKYPSSTWEQMKDAVQTGWNKVTGQ